MTHSAIRRRNVMKGFACTALTSSATGAWASPAPTIKAVAFDAFPIFDARPVRAALEETFPGKGDAFLATWRTKQFDYAWLSVLAAHYQDFLTVTSAALVATAKDMKLPLSDNQRDRLTSIYSSLKAWPDVPYVLDQLKAGGKKLALLSNFSPAMLHGCLLASGLERAFDEVLSTDAAQTYKPTTKAYEMGVAALGIPKDNVAFVAFAGWDVYGAKSFGYPTFWNNRSGQATATLGAQPDFESANLRDLLAFTDGLP